MLLVTVMITMLITVMMPHMIMMLDMIMVLSMQRAGFASRASANLRRNVRA